MSCPQWLSQNSSPVTAAGPRRIHTVFPILLPGAKPEETPRSLPESGQAEFERPPSYHPLPGMQLICEAIFRRRTERQIPAGTGVPATMKLASVVGLSLLMKSEVLPAGTAWHGIRAGPVDAGSEATPATRPATPRGAKESAA